jgi:hypothetical protein
MSDMIHSSRRSRIFNIRSPEKTPDWPGFK